MGIIDTRTSVIVLRLDHYGALGVMRSLGRWGVRVYGMHRDSEAPALRSRYCQDGFVWDLDEEPPEHSVDRLLEIASRFPRKPILVPSNDETAMFVAENAARLRAAYRFPELPADLVHALYNKRSMYDLARKLGVPTAETVFPTCKADVLAFMAGARFPIMLKGSDGIRLSRRTGHKMMIVRGAAELLEAYEWMEDHEQPDLMLQEYIPGGEDSQWMFNGYFNARSECLFGLTGRKLRQTPVYTGMTSLGVCLPNPEVEQQTLSFTRAIGYRGILDIGYRFDARDGKYKVLDINPRLGATFRLFVGADGMDVVRALYLDLTRQPVPPARMSRGRRWFVEDLDLVSSIKYNRDGKLGAVGWLRSFAGVREAAWFASDDPGPFLQMCGRFAASAGLKLVKAVARKPEEEELPPVHEGHAERVRRYFSHVARSWQHRYEGDGLSPQIYRDRRAAALGWVDALPLPRSARILEVGCGAGQTAVALARRGYEVHGLDSVPEMIRLTQRAAEKAGLDNLTAGLGDVEELRMASGSFDLVVALGVLPWLDSEEQALAEMARVLRPGGYLIATADNGECLPRLLDPRSTPLLQPARSVVKQTLRLASPPDPVPARRHAPVEVDRLLGTAGLYKLKSTSVGFGPFSLFGRRVLPERAGVTLHRGLQQLAANDWPLLRSTGAHYLVLAQKPL